MRPIGLPPNQLSRFYRGGARISALRGEPAGADYRPEDWVGAVNTTFGSETEGLSSLEDGRLVRSAVLDDPEGFLGAEHLDRYGADPFLLVKLLDAGERLPVHLHPGRAFAQEHLGDAHGKTEAWLIVEADAGASVGVGWREAVDPATVRGWIDAQDSEALLGALQYVDVAAGDALLIPAGVPHAIGGGIFMVEVQEPSDFSVLMEWAPFPLDGVQDGHLELGFDLALQSLDRSAWSPDAVAALNVPAAAATTNDGSARARMLPADADPYFRAERVRGGAELEPGFAVLVALTGNGTLETTQSGESRPLAKGDTVLVPHGAGATRLTGDVEAIRARPPAPDAGQGRW